MDGERSCHRRPPVTKVYEQRLTYDWLHDQYVVRELSAERVAAAAGVSAQTIQRALRRHDIALRPRQREGVPYSLGDVLTESFLRQAYETEERTVRSIAEEVGCSEAAVWGRLRRYDIPRRGVQPAQRQYLAGIIDPEVLRARVAAGETRAAIARDLHVDPGTVAAWLTR